MGHIYDFMFSPAPWWAVLLMMFLGVITERRLNELRKMLGVMK